MTDKPFWLPQYEALLHGAGLHDLTGRSQIELRGGDRARFLHSFCTNDIQKLPAGAGCEAFLTSHQGRTVAHVFVFVESDRLLLDAVSGQAAEIIAHLERFVISDDVAFRDLTDATGELLLAGRQARMLLAEATGSDIPSEHWRHVQAAVRGCPVQIRCVDFLSAASYFVAAPREAIGTLAVALIEAGAVSCDLAAVEALRIESGTPLFGREITADNLPQEIGRDAKAISFTKGCYLGQETVARIDALGHVNRMLVGVRFPEALGRVPDMGSELSIGGKAVGKVTSACWSPHLGQALSFALVRRAHAAPGTRLDSPAGQAEVVALPL